jgi:predicted acetyltransferase
LAFIADLARRGDPAVPVEPGKVRSDYYWIVDGAADTVVGFLALRHTLTPELLEVGGHIGFSVRPSRRREGHATRALGLALPCAAARGIARVLVTCDDRNIGSTRAIEANRGALEDIRNGKRRYWITTTK